MNTGCNEGSCHGGTEKVYIGKKMRVQGKGRRNEGRHKKMGRWECIGGFNDEGEHGRGM